MSNANRFEGDFGPHELGLDDLPPGSWQVADFKRGRRFVGEPRNETATRERAGQIAAIEAAKHASQVGRLASSSKVNYDPRQSEN